MPYRNGVYYNAAYSYEDAKRYLQLYRDALADIAEGQVKEYNIGTRGAKMLDMKDLERLVEKFADIVNKYETNTVPARGRQVVFRDT